MNTNRDVHSASMKTFWKMIADRKEKPLFPDTAKKMALSVHGYCREKTAEEREDDRKRFEDIRKIMSKYPDKPTLKERHELGGGEYIDVYQPMNPLEDVIGGKVKFKRRRR